MVIEKGLGLKSYIKVLCITPSLRLGLLISNTIKDFSPKYSLFGGDSNLLFQNKFPENILFPIGKLNKVSTLVKMAHIDFLP
jgi:hypothetical protein